MVGGGRRGARRMSCRWGRRGRVDGRCASRGNARVMGLAGGGGAHPQRRGAARRLADGTRPLPGACWERGGGAALRHRRSWLPEHTREGRGPRRGQGAAARLPIVTGASISAIGVAVLHAPDSSTDKLLYAGLANHLVIQWPGVRHVVRKSKARPRESNFTRTWLPAVCFPMIVNSI